MAKKLLALVVLLSLAAAPLVASPIAAEEAWVPLGPWGGSVASLVVDPRNPRVLYAGSAGGLYKSTDGGLSWVDIHGDLPSRFVQALAISPSAPNNLYVGVGFYPDSYGIFHSTDEGVTWQSWQSGLDNPDCQCDTPSIDSLVVHPRDPKIALASGRNSVFKTVDGGVSWVRIRSELFSVPVRALAFDPSRPSTLYVGSGHVVAKSMDGGSSWFSASTGLRESITISAISLEPGRPGALYLGTTAGVFKSSDAAGHWRLASAGLTERRILSLAVSPASGSLPATIWAGTETGAFRSRDQGASWVRASLGLRNHPIAALAIHPSTPRILWAASGAAQQFTPNAGVFKSVNGGDRWRISNHGISAQWVSRIAVDPRSPGTLWAGVSFGGVWRSLDGGATWAERSRGLSDLEFVKDLVIDPENPQVLWLGTSRGLFRTTNAGAAWELRSREVLSAYGELASVSSIRFDPHNPRVVWIGTNNGLYRSDDEGATWVRSGISEGSDIIFDFLIDPRDSNTLLVSHGTPSSPIGILSRSTNSGLTWESILDYAGFTLSLARDPADPGHILAGAGYGLSESHDDGQTWGLIAFVSAYRVAIDPVDGSIWVGSRSSIHHLGKDGSRQEPTFYHLAGIYDLEGSDLEFDPNDPDILYAGVTGRGVLRHVRND